MLHARALVIVLALAAASVASPCLAAANNTTSQPSRGDEAADKPATESKTQDPDTKTDTPKPSDTPDDKRPGDKRPDQIGDNRPDPARPDTGPERPGTGKLPDPLVILDILRKLPRWPGYPFGEDDDEPGDDTADTPQFDPVPPGTRAPAEPPKKTVKPAKPRRVVTIAANVPFKPAASSPRPPGAPPVVTGASGPEALEREVLVTLGPGADDATVFALAQDFGLDGQTFYTSALLGSRLVRFRIPDTRSIADVVQQLSTDARVTAASPHYVYTASQGAAKPLPVPQYAPQKLKLAEAHRIAQGKNVRIAVIDTAVDTKHPVFAGARIESFDALGGNGKAEAHGTAIAGIAGARAELESVAPAAALLSVRAFTAEKGAAARSFTMAILKGLDWAVLNGARVVNMSFAGPEDPILAKAIEAAHAQGLVLVAAAGNGGPAAKPAYPAAYPHVVAVTATDDRDTLYKDANRGRYIAVAAPGVDIIAAAPGGAYDISSGTSLAAAHVSGIAALMLERNPSLSTDEVRAALTSSAHKLSGPAEETGAGVADAAAALAAIK